MRQFRKADGGPTGKQFVSKTKVMRREIAEGTPGKLMIGGTTVAGTCLNCPDTPCVLFSEDEVVSPVLTGFPFNQTREVCPFDAMTVDSSQLIPVIDDDSCIGCGLCIARCPANALYVNSRGLVSLNNDENDALKTRATHDARSHASTVGKLNSAPWSGSIRNVDEETLSNVISSITGAGLTNTNQKLLIRNLLLGLGTSAAISTVGDTNFRIDMWWEDQGVLWITEVDFDIASNLDTPRALLDDIAVCVSRHQVSRNKIGAMIICLEFPNKRSGYYHLIEDIMKVVGLEILTLSVAGLLLALWSHREIQDIDLAKCVVMQNSKDIGDAFHGIVGRSDVLRTRYFGPTK